MSRSTQEARRELREIFWYPLAIGFGLVATVATVTVLALKAFS